MKKLVVVLIIGLIALAFLIPASAAGRGGDGDGNGQGKMLQNGTGQTIHGGDCQNPDCPKENCTGNQTPPRDGTGFQYGKNGSGKNK